MNEMTISKVLEVVAEMVKAGMTNEEIRQSLFNTKGIRVSQIQKVMGWIS
jgi:hypothetical protein